MASILDTTRSLDDAGVVVIIVVPFFVCMIIKKSQLDYYMPS